MVFHSHLTLKANAFHVVSVSIAKGSKYFSKTRDISFSRLTEQRPREKILTT
jgi:hypothetical protein